MSTQPEALRLADRIERLIPGDPLASALRRLHQADLSNQEWLDKTDWVQATIQPSELGQHRADVIKHRLDLVTAQRDELLKALKWTMTMDADQDEDGWEERVHAAIDRATGGAA